MRRSVATALVVLAMATAGGVLFAPVATVRVVTVDGDLLACRRVSSGTDVILTYTHSMYGGDVTETWQAAGDVLQRQSIVTDNAAAAEYYAWDGRVERAGDRFEVLAGPLEIERLAVHIDQVGRHRLAIGDDTFDLSTMVDDTTQAWIEPRTGPLLAGPGC